MIAMKTILFFTGLLFSVFVFSHVPDKTLCIKHPDAEQLDNFLKKNQSIFVEVKGSSEFAETFQQLLSKEKNSIESVNRGKVTGDFYGFQITFKKNISREEFMKVLKKAGITHLKINNSEPQAI